MPESKPLLRIRRAGRLVLTLIVLAGIGWMAANHESLDAAAIAETIARMPAAPLVFIAVHIVASLTFFPRTVLAVAAGAVFGLWMGTLWAALGSVTGALVGFLVARYVNDGVVDLESMKRFGPALLRAERGGWRAVALLRLVPVIPHTLGNYALGLTRLDLRSYLLGSLLGQLPMSIVGAEFGAAGMSLAAGKTAWIAPTAIGLAALALSLAVPRLAARSHKLAVVPPAPSREEGER